MRGAEGWKGRHKGAPWLVAVAVACLISACGGDGDSGGGSFSASAGSPSPAPKFALQFMGTGTQDIDRVKIPIASTTRVNVGDTDFTVEFWIKGRVQDNLAVGCSTGKDDWRRGNVVIDRDVNGDGDFGDFGVSLFVGRVAFGVARGSVGATICGNRTVLDNVWHHVAVTRRSATGEMQLYVDGVLDAQLPVSAATRQDVRYNTARTTAFPNSDPYLVLGAEKHDTGTGFPSFSGMLDELRFSTTVRYFATFSRPLAPFTTDGNTAALYHFDEGSGVTVGDASTGATSPGVLQVGGAENGPKWVSDTPF